MLPGSPVGSEDHSRLAGAPGKEIEITPEMITEGVRLLMNYDPDFDNERDIAEMIIRIGIMGNRNGPESYL
jgi:hypothetical protein